MKKIIIHGQVLVLCVGGALILDLIDKNNMFMQPMHHGALI